MFPRFKNHVTRDLSRHTKWSRIISRLSNYKSENKKIKRGSNENLHSWKLESLKNNPSPLQNASQLNLTPNFLSRTSNSEKERKKKTVSNNFSIHQDPKNRRKLPTLPISRNRLISRHHKFHPASRNNKRSGIYHGEKERVERFGRTEVWKERKYGVGNGTTAYCVAPARVRIPDLPRANTQRRPWIMCSINLESISPSLEAALIRK